MKRTNAEPSDEMLAVAAILGDLAAFDILALRYRAAVTRLAQSIVGRDYAEDVVQDALLLAFKALPSIEEPEKFAGWLAAITRHRAYRLKNQELSRAKGRVEMDEVLLEYLAALQPNRLEEENKNEALLLALEQLPPDYALALKLHFLDEMPLKRIAAFLSISVSTVKWRIHQGKKLLREQMILTEINEVKKWKEMKS
jgi:RNA polymerase sigma-70 factor (ECF subfamily)